MPEIKQDLRTATMIVAANDSLHRNMANYVCDGVADDVEIQAALNAVAAGLAVAGRVILLDGTYNCVADITVPGNVALEGQGFGTILDFAGPAILNALTIGDDWAKIKNLRAQLAAGAGGPGTRPNVVSSTNQFYIWLENLMIVGDDTVGDDGSDVRQCGILLVISDESKIINCRVEDCIRHGIHLLDTWDTTVEGCSCHDNGRYGIFLTADCSWDNVVGNNCDRNGYSGIGLEDSDDCTVTGNVSDDNMGHGIYLYGTERCSVSGNTSHDNGGHGISLDHNCLYNSVSGNVCISNDSGNTATFDGINASDNSIENNIVGNQCTFNARYGIGIESGPNSAVGNYCYNNDRHGIFVDAADCQINDNYCHHNGADAAGTYHGIFMGGTRCQINDNVCTDDNTLQMDGIHLADGANENQIVGNYCYRGMGSGIILVANNDNCLIKANHCNSNTRYGIEIVAATCGENRVDNNKLIGNVMGAILDNGTDTELPYIFAEVPNPNTNIGTHPATLLTDGLEVLDRINLYIPLEFQELVRVHAVVVPGGTGNMRRSVATNWGKLCSGETYVIDAGAIAAGEVAVTLNWLECLDITAAFTGVAPVGPGDKVGIEFTRHGNHVNDTVNANCYLLGVRVHYV